MTKRWLFIFLHHVHLPVNMYSKYKHTVGPVVLDMLLARVLEFGARQARPGEFSERAFLNDKLDLAQAEAIADLIDSSTQQSARAAMRSLQGEFSNQVQALLDQLIALRVFVEAAIGLPGRRN